MHYGDKDGKRNTFHGSGELNVEIGPDGRVCAVWFRCMVLPFTQRVVDQARADDMNAIQRLPKLLNVEVELP